VATSWHWLTLLWGAGGHHWLIVDVDPIEAGSADHPAHGLPPKERCSPGSGELVALAIFEVVAMLTLAPNS
jgi:hypothetical protein